MKPCYVTIEGERAGAGYYVSYWREGLPDEGNPLGTALAQALEDTSIELELDRCAPSFADYSEEETLPEGYVETGQDGLYVYQNVNSWDLSDDPRGFMFPAGIVPTGKEGSFDPSDIRSGYRTGREEPYFWLEVVVDQEALMEIARHFFDCLPETEGPEIRLLDHWENASSTDVWLGGSTGEEVWTFLEGNADDTVRNGYVEAAVYCRSRGIIMKIREHKDLFFSVENELEFARLVNVAKKIALTELDPFLSVAYGCHHYHYRLPGTRSREEMQKFLREKGFRLVDTIEAPKNIP